MKVNQVKRFVQSNISRFETNNKVHARGRDRFYNLYDKNNIYRGEYHFITTHSSDYLGVRSSISATRIMNEKLEHKMQEFVYMTKKYVNLKDKSSDTFTKALPSEITTTTTVLDFEKDKFITERTVSKLKNKLQRLGKNDPDFKYTEKFKIYEPLNEKPQYEKEVELVREGSISEINKNIKMYKTSYNPNGSVNQIPYRFW